MTGGQHRDQSSDLVRIHFPLGSDQWHGYTSESLWAKKLGNSRYRLVNSPFLAFGVSLGDVVNVRETEDGLELAQVVERGGHSTYRLIVKNEKAPEVRRLIRDLTEKGCSVDSGKERLIAVDVPPGVDVQDVYDLMLKGDANQLWDFEEGHFGGRPSEERPGA